VTRIRFLILVVAVSLALAMGGAYMAVVSQNPTAQSNAPGTVYGPLSP
jgi:ABC-type Fe3+-siderophore transport system permease subunit